MEARPSAKATTSAFTYLASGAYGFDSPSSLTGRGLGGCRGVGDGVGRGGTAVVCDAAPPSCADAGVGAGFTVAPDGDGASAGGGDGAVTGGAGFVGGGATVIDGGGRCSRARRATTAATTPLASSAATMADHAGRRRRGAAVTCTLVAGTFS